jgi:two-component system, cell cycle sensor histidine kinase and response regulator CckA
LFDRNLTAGPTTMDVTYELPPAATLRGVPGETQHGQRLNEANRTLDCERDRLLRQMQFQIERMPLAYVQFDADFRLTDWNPAAERIFGYRKAEVFGMGPPYQKLIPEEGRQHIDELFARLRSGDMAAHSINENLTKDGRTITCEWFNTPLIEDGGQFAGLLCLGQDITKRRQLEEQLRHSQKMEAVGQLASGVAHDFNNLLTIIIGYSEMLLEVLGSDQFAREPLEEIRQAAERCGVLTRQLLLYSRKQLHAPSVLDINKLVQATEQVLRRLVGNYIELTLSLGRDVGSVQADPSQLEQVLLNLAVNSRDAMPAGGRITIETLNVEHCGDAPGTCSARRAGSYVCIKVIDNGSGMSDDVKSHLFEPFFTTKEQGKGTGLGLPVVHGIVEQSDGHIEVASDVNAGTTVTIFLPRVDEADQTTG